MTSILQGSCLCGKVKYEVAEPFLNFYFCHCTRCQKSSGSAHAANLFGGPESVTWLIGKDKIRKYELLQNSCFNKSFCVECGSPVPSRAKIADVMIIPAGSLEGTPSVSPMNNIFWESRPIWYVDGCNAPKSVGYPKSGF